MNNKNYIIYKMIYIIVFLVATTVLVIFNHKMFAVGLILVMVGLFPFGFTPE